MKTATNFYMLTKASYTMPLQSVPLPGLSYIRPYKSLELVKITNKKDMIEIRWNLGHSLEVRNGKVVPIKMKFLLDPV